MPKKAIIPTQLPMEQPDCCAMCPLIGLIPKNQRQPGLRQSYVCLGVLGEPLSSKGIWTSAEKERQKKRKLHRVCDSRWEAWTQLPGRKFGMSYAHYLQYRLPYEQSSQLIIHFKK